MFVCSAVLLLYFVVNALSMSFSVVEFLDDESVDVVPSNWLVDDFCWWPPFRPSRLMNAKKREDPDKTTWMTNKARTLGC